MESDAPKTGRFSFLKQITFKDLLFIFLGTSSYACGIHFFTAPAGIVPGGVSGISSIICFLNEGVQIGTTNFLINIPIMILGLCKLGKTFMVKTIFAICSLTVMLNFVLVHFEPYHGNDKILNTIFGGICLGTGVGLCLMRGGSTGGFDIPNRIISKKMPHISIGNIIFAADMIVVTSSIIFLGGIEPALYTIVMLFISTRVSDVILYGLNKVKMVLIITSQPKELSQRIISDVKRGATILNGYGAYTHEPKDTILCAVRTREYVKLNMIIRAIDPHAFVIITDANEIVGSGFKPNFE